MNKKIKHQMIQEVLFYYQYPYSLKMVVIAVRWVVVEVVVDAVVDISWFLKLKSKKSKTLQHFST